MTKLLDKCHDVYTRQVGCGMSFVEISYLGVLSLADSRAKMCGGALDGKWYKI